MHYLLHQSVLLQAERRPEQIAFRCGPESISYERLAQQMQQLTYVLRDGGVQRGDRVGIFMTRRLETAVAIYGIMAAGAIYVPINPNLPPDQVDFLLKDCGIHQLISHPSQQRKLKGLQSRNPQIRQFIGVDLSGDGNCVSWQEVAQAPAQLPPWRILAQDLAYILYTSGSTGRPKGVMHTHYSGMSYARLTAELYDLRAEDVIGNYAPIFFDISTLGYFTAPFVGATTVLATDGHVMMPASLARLIAEEHMSVWYSVPLALVQMLQSGTLGDSNWSSLRWILYGGEPFPVKHLRTIMEMLPQCRFSNVYGPTETNQCTYYHLPGVPAMDTTIPIGQVWNNTEMLLLDADDKPVSLGETGELLIRSATMMQAYWNNPERTAESFYSRERASGWRDTFYRTGDLATLDEGGVLWLQGRKDRQVKIRGFRLELDEIELALLQYPAVVEAAVWAQAKNETEKEICAVVRGPTTSEFAGLRRFLQTKVPAYAIPENIWEIVDLPRTPTGKIDREQLQKQYTAGENTTSS